MSTTNPPPEWTWDPYHQSYYWFDVEGFHYQNGTFLPYKGPTPEKSALKIEEATAAYTSPKQENEGYADAPPAYSAAADPSSSTQPSLYCTLHQSHHSTEDDWRAHLNGYVHEFCTVHGCPRCGDHERFDKDADACNDHMHYAHFCTVHDSLVVDWKQHMRERKHYKCGIHDCKVGFNLHGSESKPVERFKRHFKKEHVGRDGFSRHGYNRW